MPDKRLTVLRAIDKLDRLGADGVRQLLGRRPQGRERRLHQGRRPRRRRRSNRVLNSSTLGQAAIDASETIAQSRRAVVASSAQPVEQGVDELASHRGARRSAAGYDDDRIRIDPSVVRGLEYYTGPVFEAELLLETKDEKGRPVRFGSVGGGGRYDGLVSRFRGEPVPATGFSIGVSRLQAALTLIGKLDAKPAPARWSSR